MGLPMSRVWFTSDWHLGHENVAKWRKGLYPDLPDDIDAMLLDTYNRTVTKRDTVYFLGDMLLYRDPEVRTKKFEEFKALPGRKILILGNHDTDRLAGQTSARRLLTVFHEVQGFIKYKQAWLSHAPIHPSELRGKINIHGHTHNNVVPYDRYFNVCPENTNWQLVPWNPFFTDKIKDLKERAENE